MLGGKWTKLWGKEKENSGERNGKGWGSSNMGPTRQTTLMRMGWAREATYDERNVKRSRMPQEKHEDERARVKGETRGKGY